MTTVFGAGYASAYDSLYSDKNYDAECDVLESVWTRFGSGAVRQILDLGCGTGNHSLRLAARGYEVTGVDRSPDMLDQLRAKAASRGIQGTRFFTGDLRLLDIGSQFDVALMMFAVLGYQIENEDALQALRAARRHLRPGGLFAGDVWYGPAVLKQRPTEREKEIPTGQGSLRRFASGSLDLARQVCTVRYRLSRIVDGKVESVVEEAHAMRFFFPRELELLMESSGFRIVHTSAFPEIEQPAAEDTWNILVVAEAV